MQCLDDAVCEMAVDLLGGSPWQRELPGQGRVLCAPADLPQPLLFSHRVVQNVVLLSDSRLHLFLQSQLSVPEIEACVQGQGSQTVTEAILHYAMSNCGWVQEEESRPTLLPGGGVHGR